MKSQFFLISRVITKALLNDSGGFNSNFLVFINPKKTESQNIRLRNFTFQIKPGQSVDLYYKFKCLIRHNFTNKFCNFIMQNNFKKIEDLAYG